MLTPEILVLAMPVFEKTAFVKPVSEKIFFEKPLFEEPLFEKIGRSKTAIVLFMLAAFTLFASLSHASTDDESRNSDNGDKMETVTVSATPIKVDDAGSSVSIITREDILRRNSPTINALLREIPGFAVSQSGSEGAQSQLRVRGAEANHLLVLVNGIEANDPASSGEFDFSRLSTSDIERIEIVRGPQSALWGSDAMVGVINIITTPMTATSKTATSKTGAPSRDASALDVKVETGSFATHHVSLGARNTFGSNRMKFNLSYLDSDGTNISRQGDEDDGMENLTLGMSGAVAARDDFSLDYAIRYRDQTSEYDGGFGLPMDADKKGESTALLASAYARHRINHQLDQAFSIARTDTDNENFTGSQLDGSTHATRDALKYQFNAIGNEHRLSLLLEHEKVDFEQRGTATPFGDPNQNRSLDTNSLALEYRHDAERFNLSVSVRQDNNSDFDDATTWRTTGKFHITPDLALHASVGESVKNPTFTERFGFYTNFQGNPNLEPETSMQWEIGVRTALMNGNFNLGLTGFSADLKNEINGFACNASFTVCTARNKEQDSERQGVEFEIAYALNEWTDLAFAYTYLDATEENASGQDLTEVRRPEHIASLSLNRTWAKGGLNLALNYTGEQEDIDFPSRVTLDSYTLLSLNGYYNINPTFRVTLRLENLLDESYEQVYGYVSPGFGAHLGLRFSL